MCLHNVLRPQIIGSESVFIRPSETTPGEYRIIVYVVFWIGSKACICEGFESADIIRSNGILKLGAIYD